MITMFQINVRMYPCEQECVKETVPAINTKNTLLHRYLNSQLFLQAYLLSNHALLKFKIIFYLKET